MQIKKSISMQNSEKNTYPLNKLRIPLIATIIQLFT